MNGMLLFKTNLWSMSNHSLKKYFFMFLFIERYGGIPRGPANVDFFSIVYLLPFSKLIQTKEKWMKNSYYLTFTYLRSKFIKKFTHIPNNKALCQKTKKYLLSPPPLPFLNVPSNKRSWSLVIKTYEMVPHSLPQHDIPMHAHTFV